MARMRWATRMATPSKVRPPWASRSSWPLRVSLTDSISWRMVLSSGSPWRAASSLREGRSSVMPRRPGQPRLQAGEPLVGDQDQPGPGGGQMRLDIDHRGQDLPLADLEVGQRPQDRHPGRGGDQVQPQPPEPARMARAVAVVRPPGQVRAPGRGPRPAAFHRRGISDPDVVGPEVAVGGQVPDDLLDQRQRGAQPLVVTRLVRQVREAAAQVADREPDPPVLAVKAQQRLAAARHTSSGWVSRAG